MACMLSATTMLKCTMGVAPSPFTVLPINMVTGAFLPLGTIMDNKPFVNIIPFVMCKSPANPAVAAIIAASLGAVQQGPCLPNTTAPWTPATVQVMIKTFPVIDLTSKLICSYGGMIAPMAPGQAPVMCA